MKQHIKWRWICSLFITITMLNLPLAIHAADNIRMIKAQELKGRIDKGEDILIIDIRTGKEYEESHFRIKGAIRISIVSLEDRIKELPTDRPIIFYCS